MSDPTSQPEKRGRTTSLSSSSHNEPPSPPSPPSTSYPPQQQDATASLPHQGRPPSSLATFLHDDIQPPPQSHRLLLPFLTTMDRLRLSECSKGLLNYRYHLTKVKVMPHPCPTPAKKRGLARLLLDQRGLEYLRVGDERMLFVLELVSWGGFEGLKTLDLSRNAYSYDVSKRNEEGVGYLTRALGGGGLKSLEELNLEGYPLYDQGFDGVVKALSNGAYPQLRRLNLGRNAEVLDDFCGEMEDALASGHLHHLQELDLTGVMPGRHNEVVGIARALQGGACPQLTKLVLWKCIVAREDGQALGEAFRSAACAKLEELRLHNFNYMDDEACMAIFGALEAGGCPLIKRLDLNEFSMSAESAAALGHALRSGHCRHLEWLDLYSLWNRDASLHVLQTVREGAMPNSIHLNLTYTNMGQEHGQVLGEAIAAGCLAKLEDLFIGGNDDLGDGGVMPIMAGLEGGGCRYLKRQNLGDVGMGPEGAHALARALASGKLRRLEIFGCHHNECGDEAMAAVIKELRRCPRLRELGLGLQGMGVTAGQALVQALQDKAWSDLQSIWVAKNRDLLSAEGVLGALVEVLEKRASLCPLLSNVRLQDTGFDRGVGMGAKLAKLLVGLERLHLTPLRKG